MGGSERIASDLFLEMDLNQDGSVNNDEISKTLDSILAKFEKEMQHDPSSKIVYPLHPVCTVPFS